ncbi:hybrid sensor histidine kinase/response regulator [Insolitispirillum peregrinum]|uniref:histidine kinase n=1 Tax=Insolitispirillum peregrinum TaxID=80876 RepID=A0A1N7LNQ1_9PROT|nr:NahK/ErcS family hybrid sensor histidine kinase/response regulator [Insolitispirillum peregrinum]SIS75446.1 PAS domain S-box-containing protein [Insolitispirillum peregrinum]
MISPAPSSPPLPETADQTIARLERENAKLRKINKVLMNRVERSMDFQGNAFSLFQTAIVLESKVRERTGELQQALADLEATNHALHLAKEEEEQAKKLLSEAIESINEGFVLCDAHDRLALTNSKYRELLPGMEQWMVPGTPFVELVRRAMRAGIIADPDNGPESWLQRRMASHSLPGEPFVIQFRNGQWVQVSERRTRDGGIVSLYTDITEIKLSERRRRERELAQKSILLQATLDNLSQGVAVFDSTNRLVTWNQPFLHMLGVPGTLAWAGTSLRQFLILAAMQAQFRVDSLGTLRLQDDDHRPLGAPACLEYTTGDGRILEIRRNHMPDGGFITTYTDITERKQSEEALRDSERRMRLVTDAIPALIAYVDKECIYRFTNRVYEEWFRRPLDEINGRPMRDVLGAELYDLRANYVELALAGEGSVFEMTMPMGQAGVQYALATYVPHIAADGSVPGFFALIQDITERRKADEQLREAKESLERRVEERTAELSTANLELAAAKGEADLANVSKTRFLAAASHDLLQPLNAARVFIAALSERRLAPRNASLVKSSLAALDSVDELLTALLDISKLDAGVLTVEEKDFGLASLMDSMINEHLMLARSRGLDLRSVPCSLTVHSDPRLLARILRNFISNALRYTQSGRIVVGCRRLGNTVMLGVWDTGHGIAEDKLDEIFEEFRRLNTPSDRAEKGMGLGLAIVKRIARMLGHPLVVKSTPGKGSLFGIVLPTTHATPLPPPPPVPACGQNASLQGARILVVENEIAIQDAMRALLEGWGCTVLAALCEADAVAVVRLHGTPDAILADYHLDDDAVGLDAIVAVQQACDHPIPAVVITANHSPDLLAEIREVGYHLLNKPLRPARLRSLLAHMLGQRGGTD